MATEIKLPRVAKLRDGSQASGRWADHNLDCYVLDDGRRVLSQRSILRLVVGGDVGGNIALYLSAVAEKGLDMNTGAIEFLSGGGTRCVGREAKDVAALANLFVVAALEGRLPADRMHLAVNANRLVAALATLALEAIVDEVTGYQAERATDWLQDRLNLLVQGDPAKYKRLWTTRLVKTLCQVYRIPHDPSVGFPVWLTGIAGKLYDLILTSDVVDAVRDMDPHTKGVKYFQHLTERGRAVLLSELSVVETLALQSANKDEFWSKVNNRYKGTPYQLSMAANGGE